MYEWSALYQQRPILSENAEFRREWFRYYDESDLTSLNLSSHDIEGLLEGGYVRLMNRRQFINLDKLNEGICYAIKITSNLEYIPVFDITNQKFV